MHFWRILEHESVEGLLVLHQHQHHCIIIIINIIINIMFPFHFQGSLGSSGVSFVFVELSSALSFVTDYQVVTSKSTSTNQLSLRIVINPFNIGLTQQIQQHGVAPAIPQGPAMYPRQRMRPRSPIFHKSWAIFRVEKLRSAESHSQRSHGLLGRFQ